MTVNSRQKGARFERLIAGKFREYGYHTRRGQQYCGANGDADVVGAPGLHLELKAVEALNIYNAMAQSKRDAKESEFPVVIHKKNNCEILVTMEWSTWIELYREWEAGQALFADPIKHSVGDVINSLEHEAFSRITEDK